jgi:cytochrome c-type biogenesis protein CcmH
MADCAPLAGRLIATLIVLWLACFASLTHAVEPGEMLADPALEARARDIGRELRCLVCQNQSIDDSDADLARDLRMLVRERLKAGDTDRQVVNYVVSRYGDFVLLRPPIKPVTWALWFGTPLIAGLGLVALVLYYRRASHAAEPPAPLREQDEKRIAQLLEGDGR